MVATPWGDTETLRDRRLPPGPSTPPEEVAQNQRERLFAAMIASVSERGYAATRVNDLVAVSGVSARSFYELFADKETCLLGTIDAIFAAATRMLYSAAEQNRKWAAASVQRTAGLLAENPALARVCLIDSLTAGPRVAERFFEATTALEALSSQIAKRRWADVPPPVVSAWVGALQELARARLLTGSGAELPKVFDDFAVIFRSYETPSAPLRPVGKVPNPRRPSLEGYDHSDRAVRAFLALMTEGGYGDVSVTRILRRASMSATTFYANFSGKADVLLAAIDTAGAEVVGATLAASRRTADWTISVRLAIGAFLNFLAMRPELASLLLVDYSAGGAPAMARREESLRALGQLFDDGLRDRPEFPLVAPEIFVACLLSVARTEMLVGGAAALPSLAPIVTHLLLAPIIGTAAATAVANDDGRTRQNAERRKTITKLIADPTQPRIVRLLKEGTSR